MLTCCVFIFKLQFLKTFITQDTEVSKSVQAVVKTLNNQDKEKKKNKNSFSMGMIHLIMHTLDPMTEGKKTRIKYILVNLFKTFSLKQRKNILFYTYCVQKIIKLTSKLSQK